MAVARKPATGRAGPSSPAAKVPLRQRRPTQASAVLARIRHSLLGRGDRIGLIAVGGAVAIVVALQPTRLFPFTSATMWLYLPVVLLVTLRWGARYGVMTAIAATLVIPSFFVNRATALLTDGASANVLHAIASVGMLAAVLGVADLNRRRLVTERERHRETEALLTAAERLNGAAEPQQVLSHVVEAVGQVLGVRRATIKTVDGEFSYGDDDAEPGASNGSSTMALAISGRDGDALGELTLYDRADGRRFTEEDRRLAAGVAHHAAIALERSRLIQDLRQSQDQLAKQAYTDALTGLPNRLAFMRQVKLALGAMRRINRPFAVLYVDLDGFKLVNDSLGHAAGDDLLVSVGQRLTAAARSEGDLVARLGGDEFAVLLEYMDRPVDVLSAAERIGMALARPVRVRERQLGISASIGIAMHTDPQTHDDPQELLREADIAMYAAKAAGKAQAVLFSPEMGSSAVDRLDLESDLHHALERDELMLYYQPIRDLRSGATVGMEALLRWRHPTRGLLSPGTFIPLAEEAGLIVPIGRWALEEACKQARAWHLSNPKDPPLRVSVNLSARQLERPEIVAEVAMMLHRTGLDPRALELELTESAVMQNARSAAARLAGLKQLGLSLAIDDFGTGYSSLAYLEQLDVDRLKIDRSFLQGLGESESAAAIVQAIVALGDALGMEVIAEGIETQAQLAFLQEIGCTHGQGFYFSKPMPAAPASRWIAETRGALIQPLSAARGA